MTNTKFAENQSLGPSSAISAPDSLYIQSMFDRLAARYDLFNHLTSMGLAVLWRKAALEDIKKGMSVLDLGCGTGDLALEALKKVGDGGEVTGLDFSANMLAYALKRYEKLKAMLDGKPKMKFVQRKAEELPFQKKTFDMIISGFVLRNLYQNIDRILSGVYESLRVGGGISFLDITEPDNKVLKNLWTLYMTTVVAFYGKILFGKNYPMFYLTDSAKRFLKKNEFVAKLEEKGFRKVRTRSFMFGIIVLYQAVK